MHLFQNKKVNIDIELIGLRRNFAEPKMTRP